MAGAFSKTVYPNLVRHYRAVLRFHDRVIGGHPGDPKAIEAHLKRVLGVSTEAQAMMVMAQELRNEGVADIEQLDMTKPEDVAIFNRIVKERILAIKNTNVFYRDSNGLFIEGRQVKAMIKESANILWPQRRWNAPKDAKKKDGTDRDSGKGTKSFWAERVIVEPDRIYLGTHEADDTLQFIGQVSGPKGPRSTMTNYEFVEGCEIEFYVTVIEDAVTLDDWGQLWSSGELQGLGAMRGQSFGKFDLVLWQSLNADGSLKDTQAAVDDVEPDLIPVDVNDAHAAFLASTPRAKVLHRLARMDPESRPRPRVLGETPHTMESLDAAGAPAIEENDILATI